MNLLPREFIIKTSELDKAEWNYHPFLRYFQRTRFRMLISLLQRERFHRLLEIGYGSGIFLPELSRFCNELYGVDTHSSFRAVQAILSQLQINANLVQASIERTPFPAQHFDCRVAISTLEFVSDIRKSCQEIHRILVPNGVLALVTPGYSAPVDFGLRVLTRTDPNAEYENRREALFAELLRHFSTARRIIFPRFAAGGFHIYLGLKLRNHIPASGAQNSL